MKQMILLFALLAISAVVWAQSAVITQCEWFTGADPGVGNGTALSVGTPEGQESLTFGVATGSFTAGQVARVWIRCRADSLRSGATNVWGTPTDGLLLLSPAAGVARLVTQLAYQVDGGTLTNVDVTDAANVNWSNLISTTGLADGLHRLQVRVTDDLGRTGVLTEGFLVISNTAGYLPRLVTQMEYRVDGGAFVPVDNADGGIVNFSQIIATNALAIGLHSVDMRSIDDLGRTGQVHRAFLVVSSPFATGQARSLVAAEYWVNVDPGPGSGVPIPLPNDGTWDSGQEGITSVLTGLPVGLYLVGFRTRDDVGRWSQATTDSLIVGPLLVISSSGNDVILNWQSGGGVSQFKIYKAPLVGGTYTLADSTTAQTYTDVGAANTVLRQYYEVTFQTATLSTFRLPEQTPVR